MKRAKRYLMAGCFVLVTAAAGGVWVAISGWPPVIIRNRHYKEFIDGFQRATVMERMKETDGNGGWEFLYQPEGTQTSVLVRARRSGSVTSVKYKDEQHERALYDYVDYTNAAEIKTSGSILYVRWVETLIITDHWILAYDLANRREISRFRVDPADLTTRGQTL